MFINNCVEFVIKGRKQHVHIIFTATKNVIPLNIGKIIIEANSREFWVVAKFNSFTFVAFPWRRTQHIILRFLWYSVGIPVVLKGNLFSKRGSLYVCIFCAIFNNLARVIYVISNCHKRKWQSCASLWFHQGQQDDYTEIFEFGKRMNFGVVF